MGIYTRRGSAVVPVLESNSNTPLGHARWFIDMMTLDYGTFYPVVFNVNDFGSVTAVQITRGYSDNIGAHGNLGGLVVDLRVGTGTSWGGNTMNTTTLYAGESYRRMCLGWGRCHHGNYYLVMLRGGYGYYLNMTRNDNYTDLSNFNDSNGGYGPQIITSLTKIYDGTPDVYDLRVGPVTSDTAASVTNQDGYWNGNTITTSVSASRYMDAAGGYGGA